MRKFRYENGRNRKNRKNRKRRLSAYADLLRDLGIPTAIFSLKTGYRRPVFVDEPHPLGLRAGNGSRIAARTRQRNFRDFSRQRADAEASDSWRVL